MSGFKETLRSPLNTSLEQSFDNNLYYKWILEYEKIIRSISNEHLSKRFDLGLGLGGFNILVGFGGIFISY